MFYLYLLTFIYSYNSLYRICTCLGSPSLFFICISQYFWSLDPHWLGVNITQPSLRFNFKTYFRWSIEINKISIDISSLKGNLRWEFLLIQLTSENVWKIVIFNSEDYFRLRKILSYFFQTFDQGGGPIFLF